MARFPFLNADGTFQSAQVKTQLDARTDARMRGQLPTLAEELGIGGSGSGTGSRLVSGGVEFSAEDESLPPFVVATTTGATVEGVALTAGQMAAFWYLNGAWHVMVHGQDTVWRSTAKPDTRIAVTPAAPTFTNDTTNGGGTWTTTSQAGVRFTPASGTATPGQKVTITATLSDPDTYRFAAGAQTSWVYTFLDVNAPIGDTFAGPAGTALTGRNVTSGTGTWTKGNEAYGFKLDGSGGIVPSDSTLYIDNFLTHTFTSFEVAFSYSDVVGRGNMVLGKGRTDMGVFISPTNVILYASGDVAKVSTSGSGRIRLRWEAATGTITAWHDGVLMGSKAGVTPPTTYQTLHPNTRAGQSIRISDLTITKL